MHEISLVRTILNVLQDEYPTEQENIRGIYLTVGILTNIQPILLKSAFDAVLLDEPLYNKALLHVHILPVIVCCSECNSNTTITNNNFYCSCGKPCNNIVQGEEMFISRVEFEEV